MYIWKAKNIKERKYIKSNRITDYDIPTFGYKSSFFIGVVSLLSILIVPYIVQFFIEDYRFISLTIESLIIGYSISYRQYFKESNQRFCRNFIIVGILMSCLIEVLLFIFYYGNIIF